MRLQLMTWPEVERYLEGSQGVIVPIGSTEQHGPIGHVGTDAICAGVVAERMGESAGAVVAPTISYGMSEHHMRFPGSVTLRPSTLVLVVRDVVLSLARHGFRKVFFLNGHGGNTASVNAGFFEAYAEAETMLDDPGALRCVAVDWWECEAAERLSVELFGDRDGDHASASEVSIALSAYPEHVKVAELASEVAPSGPVYGAADFRWRYPEGRMGSDPSLASAEHGRTLCAEIVPELVAKYQAFVMES